MGNAKTHIVPATSPVNPNRLNIIIAASGIGKGIKTYGTRSMFKVYRGMPLLEAQLRSIPHIYKNTDVYVTTGFQSKRVMKHFRGKFDVQLIYNPLYEITNVMYSISLALEACIPGDTIIIHGDILFNKEAIRNLLSTDSSKRPSMMLVDTHNRIKENKPGVTIQDDIVTNISYSLPSKWGQIVFLTGRELKLFENFAFDRETSGKWLTHETLNTIITQGGVFFASNNGAARILEINSIADAQRGIEI